MSDPSITITLHQPQDQDQMWALFQSIIQRGTSHIYPLDTTRDQYEATWLADTVKTYVAKQGDEVVAMFFIRPNFLGRGNHIANASYMVSPKHHGKGIGTKIGMESLKLAKALGYKSMQFNIVVSTNTTAVHLWKKCGFEIIGTTPKGFQHPTLGLVDTYIMYREL